MMLLDPDVLGCFALCLAVTSLEDMIFTEDAQAFLQPEADTVVDYSSLPSAVDSSCEVGVVGLSSFVVIPAVESYATARGIELANRYSVLEEFEEEGLCANGLTCCSKIAPVKEALSEFMFDYYEKAVSKSYSPCSPAKESNEIILYNVECIPTVAKGDGFFMSASSTNQPVPIMNDFTRCSVLRESGGCKMVVEDLNSVAHESVVLPLDYSFAYCTNTYDREVSCLSEEGQDVEEQDWSPSSLVARGIEPARPAGLLEAKIGAIALDYDMESSGIRLLAHDSGTPDSRQVGSMSEIGSGSSRGTCRYKKGRAACGIVRRSARLTSLPDPCVRDGTSESGASMTSLLGSTYSPVALGSLSTGDILHLARNSGFLFDDIQMDSEHIRNRELERVNTLSS